MAGRVERGVTGREKMFQQSREFGPGAMTPYGHSGKFAKPAQRRLQRYAPRPIPSGGNQKPGYTPGLRGYRSLRPGEQRV